MEMNRWNLSCKKKKCLKTTENSFSCFHVKQGKLCSTRIPAIFLESLDFHQFTFTLRSAHLFHFAKLMIFGSLSVCSIQTQNLQIFWGERKPIENYALNPKRWFIWKVSISVHKQNVLSVKKKQKIESFLTFVHDSSWMTSFPIFWEVERKWELPSVS